MTGRQKMTIEWAALLLAWLLIFVGLEGYALMQGDPNAGITLSRFTYQIGNAWPPFIFMLGITVGILTEHFWRYVASGVSVGRHLPPWLRWGGLAIGWLLIILLTEGGAAIFLCGFPIGMLVTRLWWDWNPTDANDRRG